MQKRKDNDLGKRSYLFALKIIKFLEKLPKDYISQTIGKQLLRSATSIGANIVEAQAGSSRKDFTNFYATALKSANESRFWLGILRDSGKSSSDKLTSLMSELTEIANILAASLLTLKGKK
jgi:four helix bundle protein